MSRELTSNQLKVQIGEPVLTRYERARIVGARALQISHGAPVLIETDNNDFRPHDVANKELKARVLPIGLARRLPNSRIQVIPLHWLKDREFITQIDVPEEEISTAARPKETSKTAKKSSVLSSTSISDIKGMKSTWVDEMNKIGLDTIEAIATATTKDLQNVPGVGPKTAEKLIGNAKTLLN